MNRKIWNPSAQRTIIQINSTLDMLLEKSLAIMYNSVPPLHEIQHQCQITWQNHIPDRANSGKSFTKLEQYLHILRTNSYHCLLFDGSIIRVNFKFEDDVLLEQNLLWWPAPYDYGGILQDGYAPVDLIYDFYGDSKWYEAIKMRSPIRIDFDSSNNTVIHPHSHLHVQDEETRLNTGRPICFNKFINFIFKNFYPQYEIKFSEADFIKYKIPELQELEYMSSRIVV